MGGRQKKIDFVFILKKIKKQAIATVAKELKLRKKFKMTEIYSSFREYQVPSIYLSQTGNN